MGTFVLDANICVDLFNGNLLEAVLKLPDIFVLPDVVIAELHEPEGSLLISMGYNSIQLSSENISIVFDFAKLYKKPSRRDLFALAISKINKYAIITGDSHLREAAEKERIEVHGLLWLMDKLFESRVLSGLQLIEALEKIISKGAYLPENEIKKMKAKWE